jgi:hypothetical protein
VVEASDEIRSSCEIEGVEYVFQRWKDEGAGNKGAGGEYELLRPCSLFVGVRRATLSKAPGSSYLGLGSQREKCDIPVRDSGFKGQSVADLRPKFRVFNVQTYWGASRGLLSMMASMS